MKITIDTNIIPNDELIKVCSRLNLELVVVSVTPRELEGTDLLVQLMPLGEIVETGVYGESKYGRAKYGSKETHSDKEEILAIISLGSFPKNRKKLSKGHHRTLRDAMIFHAHVREGRDIFVTNDIRTFIKNDRREKLQKRFNTQIMTSEEFIDFCKYL